MTGLEKILAQINSDTDTVCEDIKKNADFICKNIIDETQKKVDDIKCKGAYKAQTVKDDILKKANSSAELKCRNILLSAKQEIIASFLESARRYLYELSDGKYFELIYRMIGKYSDSAQGEICFSTKDLKRLPKGFHTNLKACAKGMLNVSEKAALIDGGFILKYGDVDVNCSFQSVFSSCYEQLSDAVSKLMFG